MSFYKVISPAHSQMQGKVGELVSINIAGYYNLLIDGKIYDFWLEQLEPTTVYIAKLRNETCTKLS